jgi:hypothetical protein
MADAAQKPVTPRAPKPDEICGNCTYYKPVSSSDFTHGQCWRYPPTPMVDPTNHATPTVDLNYFRPTVLENDWCGEYRYLAPTT